ncbi:outer membrane lipoprotein carrier protein LolA [Polynucleobacter sp. HIN7]|uniref:outer membrane lipoprotein carrier protein LolA n=1 Tax=Polynucleobacter sp. HIN7 TaxID=3047866 RepID=UPI0025725618|nr:outer membrane lipoprotein carrier protein LolA [Polynucleobacter sp. HIN7]BEI37637.1 outer membrane lipoprotein chaperone LolA [Polynucleobacter sp. HIN7]
MKRFIFYFVVAALAIPNAIHAQPTTPSGIEQLKQFVKTVRSAQGEFVQQQMRTPKPNEPQDKLKMIRQTSGQFIFQRPGRFVWDTQKPYEQKLIMDGKQLLMWDKDLNQLTIRSANQALAASPAAILFGDVALDQQFDLEEAGTKTNLQWVNLKPKSKPGQGDLPYTQIAIGMGSGLPKALELTDGFGSMVLVVFNQMQINPSVDASRFQFKPPQGAEVLRLN